MNPDRNNVEGFDMQDWKDSVSGKTIWVTSPPENELGFESARLFSSPVPTSDSDTWCDSCEEYNRLVRTRDSVMGHCPSCGREPGMLELGTKRVGFDDMGSD